jgi:hypothetical protein
MRSLSLIFVSATVFSIAFQAVVFKTTTSFSFSINDAQIFENLQVNLISPSHQATTFCDITFRYSVIGGTRIKQASLFIDGVENQTLDYLSRYFKDSAREFGEKLKQRVSSTIPLVVNFDESKAQNETIASPQLLSGVLLYKITGNETYLNYAVETAEWLKQGNNRQFLLFWYNTSNGRRAQVSTNGFDVHLYALVALTKESGKYVSLTNWALNEIHRIFVPPSNLSYVSVRFDESPDMAFADLGNQALRIELFSYAYSVTRNATYKQWAKDLVSAFWNRRSAINITPAYLNQNSSARYNFVKEDQHAGNFLLALESAYYFTGDDYYKETIDSYARAVSTYFWHPVVKRFMYRIDWQNGTVLWYASVHGFSLLDMGLLNAYLVTGNQTFFERARSDFDELVVKGAILRNGLIVHGVDNSNNVINRQSNWGWNKFAFTAGYMLYVLTKNATYLNLLDTLYSGLQYHWKSHGYVNNIDANSFSPLGASISLAEYVHVLNAMLYVDRESHGGAFTGNTFNYLFRELGEVQFANPLEKFGVGYFRVKGVSVGNHTWFVRVCNVQRGESNGIAEAFSVESATGGGGGGGGFYRLT